jgi:hypothetical protein
VTADAVVWHGHGLSGSYSDDACRELDPPSDLSFFHEKKLSGLAERVLAGARNVDNKVCAFTTEQKAVEIGGFHENTEWYRRCERSPVDTVTERFVASH